MGIYFKTVKVATYKDASSVRLQLSLMSQQGHVSHVSTQKCSILKATVFAQIRFLRVFDAPTQHHFNGLQHPSGSALVPAHTELLQL
jgi:hypothetical protein